MVHVVTRLSVCLLLFLLFVGNSLPVLGASQQVCLPTIQGTITTPPEQAGTILINEVLLAAKQPASCPGATTVPDPTNTSWLELYNPMALSFNLYIAHAAIDGGPGTSSMFFTFGSAIAAHGFLTIFLNKNTIFPNGTPETFTRRLLFNSTTVIDEVTLPSNLGTDQSYARVPDGASTWEVSNIPTIGRSNVLPTPTPKPTHTPKPTTAKKKSGPSKNPGKSRTKNTPGTTPTVGHIETTTPTQNSQPNVANGAQPPWPQLQLPSTSSSPRNTPADDVTPTDTTANAPPANNDSADIPRKILFTGLALACIGILFWCWRRFLHS